MKVRDEIELYAAEADKPALRWLFERNHWSSEWHMVANCWLHRYGDQSYEVRRVWYPNARGWSLWMVYKFKEVLEFYADRTNWKEQESGVGMFPSEVLALWDRPAPAPPTPEWVYDKEARQFVRCASVPHTNTTT